MTTVEQQETRRANKFTGLTAAEVEESRRQHGWNILTPPERDPWWKLFLEKFDDPVIRILMIAAFIAIAVGAVHGEYIEGVGIIIAILLATTLAFINEYKAAKEFDILNQVNDDTPVKVIRDGAFLTVPRKELVVGDVSLIELGEAVSADGEVLEAVSLQVDEASLTGESLPVSKLAVDDEKKTESAAKRAYPADRLYRGTTVMDGHGIFRVLRVGNSTEIGKVVEQATEQTEEVTPLNAQLERLSKVIGVVGFGIAALTFVALIVRGVITGDLRMSGQQWAFFAILIVGSLIALVKVWLPIVYDALELAHMEKERPEWLEAEGFGGWAKTFVVGLGVFLLALAIGWMTGLIPRSPGDWLPGDAGAALLRYFMIAVTIIVVAVPEGLAMSVTLSLAYSMRKMTASNNLVRRMHACETIGAATVICSDKTGTLTMNEMRVQGVEVPGLGGGGFTKDSPALAARLLVENISANSTAHLSRTAGEAAKGLGNPTESAMLLWLDENGIDYILHRDNFKTTVQLTFSTERKYMATLGHSPAAGGKLELHVKGAPEIVMGRCTQLLSPEGPADLDAGTRTSIAQQLKAYQGRGMRTLGFAFKEVERNETELEKLTNDLTWLGFVAIADPVRSDVPAAIRACRDAGIGVKIVTGDNSETAREIGRQIGLIDPAHSGDGEQMTGEDFSKLGDDAARDEAQKVRVLSRARPADKMRLVKLLQDQGHVVAVTGDGTNDAPALNYANVGLSMGRTGTSVAKEASDIVLLDDSFRSIVNAVVWGRSLYQNIQRFILFQLTINVAALIIALLGPFIGVALPLTVIQMLWINLIMDTFAALALATEPPDQGVMRRPPRKSSAFIVTPAMAKGIFGAAGAFVVLLIGMLLYVQSTPAPQGARLAEASTTVTRYEISVFFTTFVLLQFWNLFNARRLGSNRSALTGVSENSLFLMIAAAIFVGQVIITQFGGDVFNTAPLSLAHWVMIVLGTSLVLWIGEAWRAVQRARGGTTPAPMTASQTSAPAAHTS